MTRFSIAKFAALGVIAVATTGAPAFAGDWNYGGMKGWRGSAVPVPAPVPVPIHEPKWYLRGDIGFILRSAPGASESGAVYGTDAVGTPNTFGSTTFGLGEQPNFGTSVWSDDFGTGPTFSIGAGYYWSRNFRTDLTLGVHSEGKSTFNGRYIYDEYQPDGATATGNQIEGEVEDRTIIRSGTILFNAYYDFIGYGRFRPYIGAGLGIAISELQRRHTTEEVTCATGTPTCDPGLFGAPTTTNAKTNAVTLAASVTAGLTYNLGQYTSLDLNYRYLYMGGSQVGMTIGNSGSDVEIGDQHQHQFRAGLRWDIN